MNILLLGYGKIGKAVVKFLHSDHKITSIDNNRDATIQADLAKPFDSLIKWQEYDLAICCLPASLGNHAVKTCINNKLDCVDVSFSNFSYQELDEKAKENNVIVVYDAGFAPGIPNLIIGKHLQRSYNSIDNVRIYAGGVSRLPHANKLGYIYTWSVEDLESEFFRTARYKAKGEIKIAEPLDSLLEIVQIGPYILEGFISDGVRSLLSEPLITNISERTLRWPGHVAAIRPHLEADSFKQLIMQECTSDQEDMILMRVDIDGYKEQMVLYPHDEMTAMQRATAGTCAAIANALPMRFPRTTGVIPPELLDLSTIAAVEVFLSKRGIQWC